MSTDDKRKLWQKLCDKHTYDRPDNFEEYREMYEGYRRIPYRCKQASPYGDSDVCNGQLGQLVEYHECTACGKSAPEEKVIKTECTRCGRIYHRSLASFPRWHLAKLDPQLTKCNICGRKGKPFRNDKQMERGICMLCDPNVPEEDKEDLRGL